ncbi:hypothetical protein AOQ84DRAFT_361354 [Glonium stellatum]|uniref:Heterokaryon incompatibility domain-containing protein n=1 Tax=Glonium stellatum TaxID=574774 RepID=A0A8E2F6T8_9PEZI|nr:hypothetical protein AOQ84DRAFT_361354 [Glonium stellatum]
MRRIYKNVSNVVAWLGAEMKGFNLALETFRGIAQHSHLHLVPMKEPFLEQRYLDKDHWWQRVWTVQEAVLPINLTFVVGKRTLASDILFTAEENWSRHTATCCLDMGGKGEGLALWVLRRAHAMRGVGALKSVRRFSLEERLDLLSVSSGYRNRKCPDPRDRIYGFLGLDCGSYKNLLFPNYDIATEKLFELFTLEVIERAQNLDVFTYLYNPPGRRRADKIPSWAVDWRVDMDNKTDVFFNRRVKCLNAYTTAKNTSVNFSFISPGVVAMTGVLVDEVHAVGGYLTGKWDVYDEWQKMTKRDEWTVKKLSSAYENTASAFWHTLMSDIVFGAAASIEAGMLKFLRVQDKEHKLWLDRWWDWLRNKDLTPDPGRGAIYVNDAVREATCGRVFFTSTQGYMGTGAAAVLPGDIIVVLYGGKVPYILRRTDRAMELNKSFYPCYQILGDAYVHGVMDGKALNDPENRQLQAQRFILV